MKYQKTAAAVFCVFLFLCGCSRKSANQPISYTDLVFDTVVQIQIYDAADEGVLDECRAICKKYEQMLSRTIETSEISRINSAAGDAVTVSGDTADLIRKALAYSELSGGAFDLTIGSVTNLWDFHSENAALPSSDDLKEAVSHVNYKNVIVTGNTVRLLDKKAALDLGAIAKGFVADRIKACLESAGVRHALIDLGGNILTIGKKPDGTDYRIGIQKPFGDQGQAAAYVQIADRSVVTSGTYQRCFRLNGVLYHHILETSTGMPCDNGLDSVSIIANSSVDADALSTVCFLLGQEKGTELISQLDNVEAIFIDKSGRISCTDPSIVTTLSPN